MCRRLRCFSQPELWARSRLRVPVAVAASPQVRTEEQGIEVELRRGAITIKLLWPIGQATELAAFTRELLR